MANILRRPRALLSPLPASLYWIRHQQNKPSKEKKNKQRRFAPTKMASPTAGIASPTTKPAAAAAPEAARDAMMAWYRGEFAAANAMIDALCHHLTQIAAPDQRLDYEAVFAAIHRRRLNWVPVLHLQKYFSIAEVALELRRAAAAAAPRKPKTEPPTVVNTVAVPDVVSEKDDHKVKEKENVRIVEDEEKDTAGKFCFHFHLQIFPALFFSFALFFLRKIYL